MQRSEPYFHFVRFENPFPWHEIPQSGVSTNLEMEAEAREQRKIARLRRAAQLPPGKTFESLEDSTLPAPLMRKLRDLARGDFLEQAENALAFGLPDPTT
jgi:DNA replication protein DnaC